MAESLLPDIKPIEKIYRLQKQRWALCNRSLPSCFRCHLRISWQGPSLARHGNFRLTSLAPVRWDGTDRTTGRSGVQRVRACMLHRYHLTQAEVRQARSVPNRVKKPACGAENSDRMGDLFEVAVFAWQSLGYPNGIP